MGKSFINNRSQNFAQKLLWCFICLFVKPIYEKFFYNSKHEMEQKSLTESIEKGNWAIRQKGYFTDDVILISI